LKRVSNVEHRLPRHAEEIRWPIAPRSGYIAEMKSKVFLFLSLFVCSLTVSFAQGLDIQPNDTMQSVLQRQVGQSVELRMKSGEKIGGKLEKSNEKVVHLTQLTGAEYFEAAVAVDDIAAVVVRVKK
jgi:hypothetical protein